MKPYRIVLAAALMAPSWALAGTPIDQSRPLAADGRVRIENVKGSVQVRTWDRPQVHVGGSLGDGVKQLLVEGSDRSRRIRPDSPPSSSRSRSWPSARQALGVRPVQERNQRPKALAPLKPSSRPMRSMCWARSRSKEVARSRRRPSR